MQDEPYEGTLPLADTTSGFIPLSTTQSHSQIPKIKIKLPAHVPSESLFQYQESVRKRFGDEIGDLFEKAMMHEDESEAVSILARILVDRQRPSGSSGSQVIGDFTPARMSLKPAARRLPDELVQARRDAAYEKVIEALIEYKRVLES